MKNEKINILVSAPTFPTMVLENCLPIVKALESTSFREHLVVNLTNSGEQDLSYFSTF
ncbi:MAG: hypothetical protein IPL46_24400 [Saprospiraceae bacterium]|nr:hypothetical protein [Saprospiraceae bacterium]